LDDGDDEDDYEIDGEADWKDSVVTGWEEQDGEDEPITSGTGSSWVELAKGYAEEEAAKLNLVVVDARWTNGKLMFKVEHEDADTYSVGIDECTQVSRA